KVADAPSGEVTPFSFDALQTAFSAKPDGSGVFESGQKPIIVGQGEYNSAYGTTFPTNGPENGTVQIYDTSLIFHRLVDADAATAPGAPFVTSTAEQRLTVNLKPKMIQDEMGEAFEPEYGRMSGFLGVETANAQAGLQNMILYGFVMPPSEVLDGIEMPAGMEATPIAQADDGTQIWKFTHNGVDSHPIHFHLFDVQLLNRVTWDNIIKPPEGNELGWKDTVRVHPVEDTYFVLRPIIPIFPFEIPNSIRPFDPMMPVGNTTMSNPIDADGIPTDPIVNNLVNFGWEYMLHCHILSHEEMDMMRPITVAMPPIAPNALSHSIDGNSLTLTWMDNSITETEFEIEVTSDGFTWVSLGTIPVSLDQPNTHGPRSF